jgi:hypothetical protein
VPDTKGLPGELYMGSLKSTEGGVGEMAGLWEARGLLPGEGINAVTSTSMPTSAEDTGSIDGVLDILNGGLWGKVGACACVHVRGCVP